MRKAKEVLRLRSIEVGTEICVYNFSIASGAL